MAESGGEGRVAAIPGAVDAMLDALGDAVIVTTPDGVVLAWNRAAESLYGWSTEEAIGHDIVALTSSGPSAETAAQIMAQLKAGVPWSGEFAVRCKDLSTRLVSVTDIPTLSETGEIVAIVGVSRDVTDQRGQEDLFRRRQEQLAFAFEAARLGSWSWDIASGVVEWDPAMEALYGLNVGEFAGTLTAFLARIHPDDRENSSAQIATAGESRQDLLYEHRVLWPDGSMHWLEGRGRTILDDDDEPIHMVGVGIDIDHRKQLEAAALEAATLRATAHVVARLEDAERIAKLGSWYWDAATNEVTLSAEMSRFLGSSNRLSGEAFRDALQRVSHPDDVAVLFDAPARMLVDHKPFVIEQRVQVEDSRRVVVHRGEIAEGGHGALLGIRGTMQDITEQREMEVAIATARETAARERRAVAVLNETLIRPEFPTQAGFDFAARYVAVEDGTEVGGDWYDAFEVPDGRIMLTIGDVSGHGLNAARLMAKLRHAARAYACIDPRPDSVLVRLDNFLGHFASGEEFATIQIALLDPAASTVTIVSAGHPPPLLVQQNQSAFVDVSNTEPASFFAAGRHPEAITIAFPKRSALLFYTDGLIERRRESLDDGLRRLADHVTSTIHASAEQLCEAALAGALEGTKMRDDVCVLALVHQDETTT